MFFFLWFGFYSVAGRFVHTTLKTLTSQHSSKRWDMKSHVSSSRKSATIQMFHRFTCFAGVARNAAEVFVGKRTGSSHIYLTDNTCWNGCKMMRTCVWTVYFVDPWPHFSWNVPENESIRTNPKIWPAAYHFLSEQPLKSLALVQRFLVMPVTHIIKDEDLSGSEKEALLMIIVLLAWCLRLCFMFPSNHMLFL